MAGRWPRPCRSRSRARTRPRLWPSRPAAVLNPRSSILDRRVAHSAFILPPLSLPFATDPLSSIFDPRFPHRTSRLLPLACPSAPPVRWRRPRSCAKQSPRCQSGRVPSFFTLPSVCLKLYYAGDILILNGGICGDEETHERVIG